MHICQAFGVFYDSEVLTVTHVCCEIISPDDHFWRKKYFIWEYFTAPTPHDCNNLSSVIVFKLLLYSICFSQLPWSGLMLQVFRHCFTDEMPEAQRGWEICSGLHIWEWGEALAPGPSGPSGLWKLWLKPLSCCISSCAKCWCAVLWEAPGPGFRKAPSEDGLATAAVA